MWIVHIAVYMLYADNSLALCGLTSVWDSGSANKGGVRLRVGVAGSVPLILLPETGLRLL